MKFAGAVDWFLDLEGVEHATFPPTWPVWSQDLDLFDGNPIIEAADVGADQYVADPCLLVVDGTLYLFFERRGVGEPTEIWRVSSDDGLRTWSDPQKVSHNAGFSVHNPSAFIYNGEVHLTYVHASGSTTGDVWHRTAPTDGFASPTWSAASRIFRGGSEAGWTERINEAALVQWRGVWYLLVTAGADDTIVRVLWCGHFTLDWNADGIQMPGDALHVDDHDWLNAVTHPKFVHVGDTLLLITGMVTGESMDRAIGAAAVKNLSPQGMSGEWLRQGYTFVGSDDGVSWDGSDLHQAHAAMFGGEWVFAYDGRKDDVWRIGVAHMPVEGQPRTEHPAGVGDAFEAADHDHDGVYAPVGHEHDGLDVDSHRLVVLVDDGAGGVEPLTDGDGLWLYGDYPGTEH